VNVLYGSATGITDQGNQFWNQGSPGIPEDPEKNDGFGRELGTGDLNADGYLDLVIGVADESIGAIIHAGGLHVFLGSAAGLTASGTQFWSQDSPGILDGAEKGDRFGRWFGTSG
jgi:hypothetical protein